MYLPSHFPSKIFKELSKEVAQDLQSTVETTNLIIIMLTLKFILLHSLIKLISTFSALLVEWF